MIPIAVALVSMLAEKGLSLIGNAIEAKGKEVVEDKLGVKIPDDPKEWPPELATKLQELQAKHEEFLITAANKSQELSNAEMDSARQREIQINAADSASYLSKNTSSILALVVVIGGGALLAFSPDVDVKYGVVSLMSMVLGYYFGTSVGATKTQQTLRDIAVKK